MKTLKHNRLQKKRLTNKKYINTKNKLTNRKSKLTHRKSKLIHKSKKGGNPQHPSILYLKKAINYYTYSISNPLLFNDNTKKVLLNTFKHNIDNIYKCAKMLDFLYTDLDTKFVHTGESAKYKVQIYFKFMTELKNNFMMLYLPCKYFYNDTECYLNSQKCNIKEYSVFNKILIKKFINYFIDILAYQTINYYFSKQSELNIYIQNNSKLTKIINQIIYNDTGNNDPEYQLEYQSTYISEITYLFNILRKPTKEKLIIWSTNNYENIIFEEILKLYDQVMIFAETIQYHINEKRNRKKKIKSPFILKTHYNDAYIDLQYKFIREYIKNILDFYYVINKIFTDSTLYDIILKYPIIDIIIQNKDKAKDIIDNPNEYIKNRNNNNLLSNYLGHQSNNYQQQTTPATNTNKELQSKTLKTLSSFESYDGKSNNKEFLNKLMGKAGEIEV
jgi:hypothetical protein